ncbi:hypothetical protein PR048_030093 [Dryococelus australis]|uniref:Uncharacterized protein n=1 Tax=Dryococelus australis TaxID=614101 RepID=A0ABQ9G7Y7_9NEOP|nr:hypothetical protein PR048_030093 [Dryococelus australis]
MKDGCRFEVATDGPTAPVLERKIRMTRGCQHRFSISILRGIFGDHLNGSYMFSGWLMLQQYLVFLRDTLPELLEVVVLDVQAIM